MRDMTIGHDPVVVAYDGLAKVLSRSPANRAVLANGVSITNSELRWLVGVFLILRVITDGGKLIDMIVFANFRWTINDDVTVNSRTAVNLDVVSDHAVRANLSIIGDSRFI